MLTTVSKPQPMTVRYFREHIPDDYINIIACYARDGDIKNMSQVLHYGFDININLYNDGTTLLTHAIAENQYEMCEFLLKNGADVNIEIDEKNLLIMLLKQPASSLDLRIFKLIVDAGCNIEYEDFYGVNPLYYAIINGHFEACEYLIRAGVNTNIIYGVVDASPLHIACQNGNYDMCVLLVEYGVDIFAKTYFDTTPSDFARYSNIKLYEYLKLREQERELLNQSFKRGNFEADDESEIEVEKIVLEEIENIC